MELSVELVTATLFRTALSFLALVAFAGAVAVPTEGLAIRLWGRGSRMHRTANGVLYTLCGLTVLAVFYAAGVPRETGVRGAETQPSRTSGLTADA